MTEDERTREIIARVKEAVAAGEETLPILLEYPVLERARVLTALFNDADYELMPQLLPPHHVHDMRPFRIPDMGVFRGREEYSKFISGWIEAFPHAQLVTEFDFGIAEPSDAAFGVVTQRVQGGGSEVPIAFRYAWVGEHAEARSESVFGSDVKEMRQMFLDRFGVDPRPQALEPIAPSERQEA